MLGQQFYHETTRKVVVAFGTLFNGITLVRKDNSGTIQQSMKVPLAYGPRQKYLVRLADDPDLSKSTAVTLPASGLRLPEYLMTQQENYNVCRSLKKSRVQKQVS